jgi:hypothetical protein
MIDLPKDPRQSVSEQQCAPLVTPTGLHPVDQLLTILESRDDIVTFSGRTFSEEKIPVGGTTAFRFEGLELYLAPKKPVYDNRSLDELCDDLFAGNKLDFEKPNFLRHTTHGWDNTGYAWKTPAVHVEAVVRRVRFTTRVESASISPNFELSQKFGLTLATAEEIPEDTIRDVEVIGSVDAKLFPHKILAEEAAKFNQAGRITHPLCDGWVNTRQTGLLQQGIDPFIRERIAYQRLERRRVGGKPS